METRVTQTRNFYRRTLLILICSVLISDTRWNIYVFLRPACMNIWDLVEVLVDNTAESVRFQWSAWARVQASELLLMESKALRWYRRIPAPAHSTQGVVCSRILCGAFFDTNAYLSLHINTFSSSFTAVVIEPLSWFSLVTTYLYKKGY